MSDRRPSAIYQLLSLGLACLCADTACIITIAHGELQLYKHHLSSHSVITSFALVYRIRDISQQCRSSTAAAGGRGWLTIGSDEDRSSRCHADTFVNSSVHQLYVCFSFRMLCKDRQMIRFKNHSVKTCKMRKYHQGRVERHSHPICITATEKRGLVTCIESDPGAGQNM
ncbi:uncharacterized protein LY89DRAFT_192758 [Mollisia scopiformis]|uniref:Uncharacterized protein n=1 Tax=Mollisia scopiformis TaxID=149040 RepID=A0A194WYL0_MOLSC|nr:uncharacterized protein LY89DRAFT_192758 [Mollisia scopiformis]KUJ12774.1 hypothetical protein LY89DRAFT_192758 [Mollisia scopiformis]